MVKRINMHLESPSPQNISEDTIAAFATAIGGPIVIIRISGDNALQVTNCVWHGRQKLDQPPFRTMKIGRLTHDDQTIDSQVLAVYMPGPSSYTGEDMVEIHCHGGALGARLALIQLLESGARHAEPGEFTKRAFLNGKMDLTRAEAVADLINAQTEAALHLANRQLQGRLGARVDQVYDRLSYMLSEIEVRLDFPEENLDWVSASELQKRFTESRDDLTGLMSSQFEGEILREGINLVIAGPPNVGKSSLMNLMLGRDRAIVTHLPGTTRDTLEELAHVRGIPLKIVDTAGIREVDDLVEQQGISRSLASLSTAQVVLWLVDASRAHVDQLCSPQHAVECPEILVANKCDLLGDEDGEKLPAEAIRVSALTGEGLEELYDRIEEVVWASPHREEPIVAVSARHAALINEALEQLKDAEQQSVLEQWELAAIGLRQSLTAIGRITGRTAAPDVLDNIFSRFCIGK